MATEGEMDRDQGAFRAFHRHYEPYVRAFAARRVQADVVDEVVTDVFAAAWRHREELPDDALLWLYATARNVVGTHYRSASRWRALKDRLAQPESQRDLAASIVDADEVHRALTALSDDDRELLLLVAWEGLAHRDVAETLGIATGTVSVRLHRARNRFRTALAMHRDQEVER